MKVQKPYLIETKNYIQIYYGGTCNPEKLKTQRRSKITKFTRQSQKRLLEKIDTAFNFYPNYIMKFYFNKEVEVLNSNLILLSFFVSFEKYFQHVVKKIPLVFWRKCFKENEFWYECLTEIPPATNMKAFLYIANMYWKLKVGNQGKVELVHFYDKDKNLIIQNFCFENSETDKEDVGRYWGMIYKKYYKFKKLKKKTYSAIEIKERTKNLKPLQSGKIKRYMFEKEN